MLRAVTLAWLVCGCVIYDNSTHLVVRDPNAVTATIRPYEHEYDRSWIERSADGAIDVWCAECSPDKRKTYTKGREITVTGTPAEHLHIDGDQVTLHVDYQDLYVCGPRRGRHTRVCWKPALAVDLVTPRSNVESIRYDHLFSSANAGDHGAAMIATASVWSAFGVLLIALGIHDREGEVIGIGIGMLPIGIALGGYGIYNARAHDTVTNITACAGSGTGSTRTSSTPQPRRDGRLPRRVEVRKRMVRCRRR